MELIIAAVVIALLVYGLERNKPARRTNALTGSTTVQDRDIERLTFDLITRP